MQAVVLTKRGQIELTNVPIPSPKENEALVKIQAAALNRRDYFITQNLYPLIEVSETIHSHICCERSPKN